MSRDTSAAQQRPNALVRYVPILGWLPQYQKSWLAPDLIAGLSVWALVVPQALGYSEAGILAGPGARCARRGLGRFISGGRLPRLRQPEQDGYQ
jgi:hypothetical protein